MAILFQYPEACLALIEVFSTLGSACVILVAFVFFISFATPTRLEIYAPKMARGDSAEARRAHRLPSGVPPRAAPLLTSRLISTRALVPPEERN
jgi:hypothetical protein